MKTEEFQPLTDGAFGPAHAVAHPQGGRFWVRPAQEVEIEAIHRLIASEISPDVGPVAAMLAVFRKNPISFWRIEHQTADGAVMPIGMFGFLPLNKEGLAALTAGTLDRREPPIEFVCPAGDKPAA